MSASSRAKLPGLHSLQLRVTTSLILCDGGRGPAPRELPNNARFFVPSSRHLLCSLCDDNFKEVVLPCGHTFCRDCVLRWFERQHTCPECRADTGPGAPLPTNWMARAQVDELRVRCRFGVKEEGDRWVADEAGCPAQLTLDGAAAHEATCGFATTTCPFAGCGVELRRSELEAHHATFAVAHARGERDARLAGESRLAAVEARFALFEQRGEDASSRFAAMEARLLAFEGRLPVPTVPVGEPAHPMLSSGWTVRHTMTSNPEEGFISCCAFSPDSRSVCIATHGGMLKLFDVASGEYRSTLAGHENGVAWCAFSPDGATIVSASADKTVKLWNAASGAVLRTLEGHTSCVICCAFSPDGRLFWILGHVAQTLGRRNRRLPTHAGRPHKLGPLLCIQRRRRDGAFW